eukprot:c13451_g1_i1.p1 GENE.c13451_g1_i1~~c13451_g1_i1.p1  ORF type:complete len:817 (-),score=108.55 c13451_g1_i1:94-2544(-)
MGKLLMGNTLRADSCPDDFPRLGIRLDVFQKFIDHCGGREKLKNLTTNDVCEAFVKPETQLSKSTYCDLLIASGQGDGVAKATVFISHAWKFLFLDVVDALCLHFRGEEDAVVLWFDLFSNNQHTAPTREFKWWCNTFLSAIKSFGRTVMVLSPWDDPVPLTRAWCLFELYAAIQTDSRFEIALPPTEDARFHREYAVKYGVFDDCLSRVDVRKSCATNYADQTRIHQAVQNSVGHSKVNSMVFEHLRAWVIRSAKEMLDKATQTNGPDHPDTLGYLNNLAALYKSQGNWVEAQRLHAECLEKRKRVLGEDHADTLRSYNNLATVYVCLRDHKRAEDLYQLCVEKAERLLGPEHEDTLTAIGNFGELYLSQGLFDKAEPLLERCLNSGIQVLGNGHLVTQAAMNNLASLYKQQHKYDNAEALFRLCFEVRSEMLGRDHPNTLLSQHNLASVYEARQQYNKAEVLLSECVEKQRALLGHDHPTTRVSQANLSLLRQRVTQLGLVHERYEWPNLTSNNSPRHPSSLLCPTIVAFIQVVMHARLRGFLLDQQSVSSHYHGWLLVLWAVVAHSRAVCVIHFLACLMAFGELSLGFSNTMFADFCRADTSSFILISSSVAQLLVAFAVADKVAVMGLTALVLTHLAMVVRRLIFANNIRVASTCFFLAFQIAQTVCAVCATVLILADEQDAAHSVPMTTLAIVAGFSWLTAHHFLQVLIRPATAMDPGSENVLRYTWQRFQLIPRPIQAFVALPFIALLVSVVPFILVVVRSFSRSWSASDWPVSIATKLSAVAWSLLAVILVAWPVVRYYSFKQLKWHQE